MTSISLWRNFCLLAAAVVLVGCDNPQKDVDVLRAEISQYRKSPTDAMQAKIDDNLAKLEAKVVAMERKNETRAVEYRRKLETLQTDYQAARVGRAVQGVREAVQSIGDAFRDGAKSLEKAVRDDSTND